jgi:2-succinyl-5-enolpyruvyl-6-hydroxy-3-cyclohexene-1-carboxylate synthase
VDTYKNLTKIIPVQPAIALKLFVNENLQNASNYRDLWLSLDKKLTALFKNYMQTVDFSDLWVTQEVLNHTPKNSYLHLANSTAVRYSNLFNICSDRFLKCYSNRGTSGIDGTVSTAVGAASVTKATNTLITGDLSFLYDSNALWIKPFPQNLKIVVINNGGGSIFRIIDGPASTPELEQFFEAKHDISLEYLCKTFGVKYSFADSKTHLNIALQNLYTHNNAEVLEVKTNYLTNPIVLKNYFTYLKNNL